MHQKTGIQIGLALFAVVTATSCKNNSNNDTATLQKLVKTEKVTKTSTVINKHFPSVIEEAEEVNLAFRVAGPIQKIYVNEGKFVKKGELIAEMDPRDYEVQKIATEAQVVQLRSEYQRIEELKKRKSVPENDYEKMKAGKEMAEAKLKNAVDQLKDTKLYAPFSGYVTKVMFEGGELVNHGTPIATMVNVSRLKVEINVPPSLFINKDYITEIECCQDNIPGKIFPLTLYSNNIKANSNGLYKLYLYYTPTPGAKLAPGMNVSVNVKCVIPEQELFKIPAKALFEKDDKTYVWIVNDSKIHAHEISTNSLVKDGYVEVTNGVKEGDEIVVGGLNLLKENETVKIVPPASKTNIGNIL